jgi:hypothetical protein
MILETSCVNLKGFTACEYSLKHGVLTTFFSDR